MVGGMADAELNTKSQEHLLNKLQKELAALTSGAATVSRMEGGRWVDATEHHAKSVRRSIAHLEALLMRHRRGHVASPNVLD
jgi:hypothetical protein